jgi:hypothetical protein
MELLSTMARYNEVQADYRELLKIVGEIGEEVTDEDLKLKEDLDRRSAAGDDGEQRRRDEPMRAIDVSAMSIHHMSQDKTIPHRFEASSFLTARHFPYPYRNCTHLLGQILTQNPCQFPSTPWTPSLTVIYLTPI